MIFNFAEEEAKQIQRDVQSQIARKGRNWDFSLRFLDAKARALPATFLLHSAWTGIRVSRRHRLAGTGLLTPSPAGMRGQAIKQGCTRHGGTEGWLGGDKASIGTGRKRGEPCKGPASGPALLPTPRTPDQGTARTHLLGTPGLDPKLGAAIPGSTL